jgi:hypothetical protein
MTYGDGILHGTIVPHPHKGRPTSSRNPRLE